jgi:hypothetical protein
MKKLIITAVLGTILSALLAGCVVAPIGPGYYHPHYYHY